ncbi:MAG: NupC/NupG family nucleoside CNT transporter, partial [Alphaproteobacteria bacterium]
MLVIAFQLLPLVIVVGALAALLWHWRILPIITRGFAWALQRTLGIGGAVGLGSAANLFLGMVEAPLFIRAYIPRLTRSELFMLMTVGLSTVSGTVLVLYATTLEPVVEGAIGHILTASIISLPAAVLMSKIMIPDETATDTDEKDPGISYASSMDAVTQGTQDGLKLFLNIIAMLIVVFALVALADSILAFIGEVNGEPVTLQRIFGWLFSPLVVLFGVPLEDAAAAGSLMGTKAILNEFVAYLQLAGGESEKLTPRTVLIMTYAMCGFANLGSVGMLISALSTLAPERRPEIAELGLRSFLAGNLATGMTGAVVGLITWG